MAIVEYKGEVFKNKIVPKTKASLNHLNSALAIGIVFPEENFGWDSVVDSLNNVVHAHQSYIHSATNLYKAMDNLITKSNDNIGTIKVESIIGKEIQIKI